MIRKKGRLVLTIFTAIAWLWCMDATGQENGKGRLNSIKADSAPQPDIDKKVNELLGRLTASEKADFLTGKNSWELKGLKRLDIPVVNVKDGGSGVTIRRTGCATAFPTAIAQAAAWDEELVKELGVAIAEEAKEQEISIMLAPMVNIQRIPINGRNYESFSEDPFLTGRMAVSFIQGIQSRGIGAVIKHLAANNQQYDQKNIKSEVDERTLHEIYLPAFEMAVKEADPVGVMTSYNGLNGLHSSESSYLIKDMLKSKWGYKGFVVSDWNSVQSDKVYTSGLDIEMPGPGKFMKKGLVMEALRQGHLSEDELDDKVGRYLRALFRLNLIGDDTPSSEQDATNAEQLSEQHRQLAQRIAESSIVLLKNDSEVLPFDSGRIKRIAVIGPNAAEMRLGGGGSASVTACSTVSPLEGLRQYLPEHVAIDFVEGASLRGGMPAIPAKYLSTTINGKKENGLQGEYFSGFGFNGKRGCVRTDNTVNFSWGWGAPCESVSKNAYSVRWTGKLTAPGTGEYKLGLSFDDAGARLYINGELVIDDWGDPENEITEAKFRNRSIAVDYFMEEGKSYDITIEFHRKERRNSIRFEWLVPNTADPIGEAVETAKRADAVVVFAGISNLYEGGDNDRKDIDLPGTQNDLIQKVLSANKNTAIVLINGSPLTMPWIDQAPAVLEAFYPGQEGGAAIARVLFGEINPSGKLPQTFPVKLADNATMKTYPGTDNKVEYKEGIYVGYRQFDKDGLTPLFPFGHGLSYTTFDFSDIAVRQLDDQRVSVRFNITNSGKRDGAEVAQVYVSALNSKIDRPVKELKGFTKVTLAPSETQSVEVFLDKSAFSYYDTSVRDWVFDPGKFEISVGSSSRNLSIRQTININ